MKLNYILKDAENAGLCDLDKLKKKSSFDFLCIIYMVTSLCRVPILSSSSTFVENYLFKGTNSQLKAHLMICIIFI